MILRQGQRIRLWGSFFAWQCGKERQKHLRRTPQTPKTRTSAWPGQSTCVSTYAEAGKAALKKFDRPSLRRSRCLGGLTRHRRGQKDAVPRALEGFRQPPEEERDLMESMVGVPHRNLQKRLLVLLSNSARRSNVPQPSLPEAEEKQFDCLVSWWKQHGDKVTLRDPWMRVLEQQKVD